MKLDVRAGFSPYDNGMGDNCDVGNAPIHHVPIASLRLGETFAPDNLVVLDLLLIDFKCRTIPNWIRGVANFESYCGLDKLNSRSARSIACELAPMRLSLFHPVWNASNAARVRLASLVK